MTGESTRCPDPEVLAAFVAGDLSGDELKETMQHLRTCEDCRIIVGDIAFVGRDEAVPAVRTEAPSAAPWWLAVAAAALIGIAYLSYWYTASHRDNGAIRTLVAAAPREGRSIEPRLSGGFPWAPLRTAHRAANEPLDAGEMKLVGAAGEVLARTANDPSVEAQHAAALAHLVAGRAREAETMLSTLAARAPDARVHSDAAAARLVVATHEDDPGQLAQALAEADAALRFDPNFPEALFNRALILERLGLREQAVTAWRRYLRADGKSDWSREARQHLDALNVHTSFRLELDRTYQRLAADPAAARALAVRYLEEARLWGETGILGRWADAWQSGDIKGAAAHLRIARAFGAELAERSAEHMLQSAVAAIDGADDEGKRALAAAQIEFRDAQKAYQLERPAEAGVMFADAERRFEEGHSPLSLVARYFCANTAFDQGKIAQARSVLAGLAATSPVEFPAHRAQVQWELGLANASLGHWGEAMLALRSSIAIFERIGNAKYATAVREILAEVYDRIGEPAEAWHHRLIALREIGRTPNARLRVVVESIARAAILDRDWPVAFSFLGVELEVVDKNDLVAYAETRLLRARVEDRLGRLSEAARDLSIVKSAVSRLKEPAMRDMVAADYLAAAACLASPADAVAMLTRAIDFHRVKGRPIFVPELLLERGRAQERFGHSNAAAEDFDAAIKEVEAQRRSIEPGGERWGVFASSGDLFDEAIGLAAARGDARAALGYAERSRGRDVLDRIRETPAGALDPDTVLIEYAALPNRLVIFVLNRGQMRLVQQDIDRTMLAAWVDSLAASAVADDRVSFRNTARLLYSRLVAPVRDSVSGAHLLVFIPDPTLSRVPFSALVNERGRYLVEEQPVVVAPSCTVYERLASRRTPALAASRALVISGSPSRDGDGGRDLTAIRREAESVASAYGQSVIVGPQENEQHALVTQARGIDVIHFAGHGIETYGDGDAALLTAAGDVLTAREIESMRFNGVRVVVLSACDTARGGGSHGVSVAQAFLAAGVPSVVATLWPIADGPAADFFPRLHRRLAERVPAAEALRETQLEWIHGRDAPPSLWASVEIIGS